MSPDEVEHQRSSYTMVQQEEFRWRTGEWEGKRTEPSPEFVDAILMSVHGEVHLTSRRNINVIEEDGSNNRYSGKITLSLTEGDPKLSRMHAVPAYNIDNEEVDASLDFSLYVSRAQLEALFRELGGTADALGFRLDAYGFMFGPERSFATFQQTQDYYLERTAIISEFSISTHAADEVAEGLKKALEPEPAAEPAVAPAPVDYRPDIRRLALGVVTLIALSVLILGLLLLRTCSGQ